MLVAGLKHIQNAVIFLIYPLKPFPPYLPHQNDPTLTTHQNESPYIASSDIIYLIKCIEPWRDHWIFFSLCLLFWFGNRWC